MMPLAISSSPFSHSEELSELSVFLPGSLLEQTTSSIGDLLVLAAVLLGVDLAAAVLLLDGIEAWSHER